MAFEVVDGADAYSISTKNFSSKWPGRSDKSNRLFPNCAPAFSPSFQFDPGESIFTIGSCFARNVELALRSHGFVVPALDFTAPADETFAGGHIAQILNKYTPFSMLNELDFAFDTHRALKAERYLLEGMPDNFMDYQIHVTKPVNKDRALERREQVRQLYCQGVRNSRVVIITLGLSEAWFDSDSGVYINLTPSHNMVRKYPGRFQFEVLSYEKTYSCVENMIDVLAEVRGSDLRVVMTVSPVPIQRTFTQSDVIVANMYSKCLLRVVAEGIVRKFDFVDYYPSFESVILSDPSFSWQDDQVHVTREAVEFNVRRMVEGYTHQGDVNAVANI